MVIYNTSLVESSLVCGSFSSISINDEGGLHFKGLFPYSCDHSDQLKIQTIQRLKSLSNIISLDCSDSHIVCCDNSGKLFIFSVTENLLIHKSSLFTRILKPNIPIITKVSCGNLFTICLDNNGFVWSFGNGRYGKLGHGNNKNINYPKKIKSLSNIKTIQCGYNFVISQSLSGICYAWGCNIYGQLGNNSLLSSNIPTQCLLYPENIISIKCGKNHSLLLTHDGKIYSHGYNKQGQLGLNLYKLLNTIPKMITDIPFIIKIECGYNHSLVIDINNALWLFGNNTFGQLGCGKNNNIHKPIKHPKLNNIIDLSHGGNHTFVKTIDNKIYAFGNNEYDQLGIKTLKKDKKKPIKVFQECNKTIWTSNYGTSRIKSARN